MNISTTIKQKDKDGFEQYKKQSKWKDYQWQLKHSIQDVGTFEKLTGIRFKEREKLLFKKVIGKFPLSITPYYLSLIDVKNYQYDPIFLQAFPRGEEMTKTTCDMSDPLAEDKDSPVPNITHRYPDRVLFLVSNTCSMYCRTVLQRNWLTC